MCVLILIVQTVCHTTIRDLTIIIWAGSLVLINMTFIHSKIPKFDEENFLNWKALTLEALDLMDYNMMKIINEGPHIPMTQTMKDDLPDRPMVQPQPYITYCYQ